MEGMIDGDGIKPGIAFEPLVFCSGDRLTYEFGHESNLHGV